MPFDPDDPPEKVRGLSEKKQRQWCEIFNSCWKQHQDDGKCHAMAWGVVKKASDDSLESAIGILERMFGIVAETRVAESKDEERDMDVRDSQGCGCTQSGDCGCQQSHSLLPSDEAIIGRRMR